MLLCVIDSAIKGIDGIWEGRAPSRPFYMAATERGPPPLSCLDMAATERGSPNISIPFVAETIKSSPVPYVLTQSSREAE